MIGRVHTLQQKLLDMKAWIHQEKKTIGLSLFGLIVLTVLLFSHVRLLATTSASIPYALCVHILHGKPRKGELCAFQLKDHTFVKYIKGVAGDRIKILQGVVYVEDQKIGEAHRTSLLSPISEGLIPQGYVFVAGTHEHSLDSRYQEFGLIPTSALQGRVWGLFKYGEDS